MDVRCGYDNLSHRRQVAKIHTVPPTSRIPIGDYSLALSLLTALVAAWSPGFGYYNLLQPELSLVFNLTTSSLLVYVTFGGSFTIQKDILGVVIAS